MSTTTIMNDDVNDKPKIRKTIDNSFKEQQDEILNKLLNILNIEKKGTQIIERSDLNIHKDEIELLLDDIMKYYHSNVWNTIKQSQKKYMSICRQLFKHHLIGFSSKVTTMTKNNKSIKITKYQIKFE
jgi:hypothetical protein